MQNFVLSALNDLTMFFSNAKNSTIFFPVKEILFLYILVLKLHTIVFDVKGKNLGFIVRSRYYVPVIIRTVHLA